jgi:hypothetical protein
MPFHCCKQPGSKSDGAGLPATPLPPGGYVGLFSPPPVDMIGRRSSLRDRHRWRFELESVIIVVSQVLDLSYGRQSRGEFVVLRGVGADSGQGGETTGSVIPPLSLYLQQSQRCKKYLTECGQ